MKVKELKEKIPDYVMDLKLCEKAKRTYSGYRREAEMFLDTLEDEHELTKDDVINYKQSLMQSDYKTRTIELKIVSVNKFLGWVGLRDFKVKQIKKQKTGSLPEVISVADYKRMLRHAKALGDMQIYMIIKVFAQTGIRIAELKFFTVEDLDTYIKVTNKGKTRTVIVRQDLVRELRKYARDNRIKQGAIFTYSERTIRNHLKNVASHAHVKKSLIHPHAFRHFFAIQFLEQNSDNFMELADILGHENLETTRVYLRTTDKMKKQKLERMKF